MDNKDSFDRFSSDLDLVGIKRRSRGDLADMHTKMTAGDIEAHGQLWLYGVKLVLKIVNKLRDQGLLRLPYEDSIAVGNLAIGEALTRWDPLQSSFSTWVWIRIRGAVLNEDAKHAQGYMVGSIGTAPLLVPLEFDVEVSGSLPMTNSEVDLYHTTPSEGEAAVGRAELLKRVEQLPVREREYVKAVCYQGISPEQIGLREGINPRMVRKVLQRGINRLRKLFEE